MDSLENDIYAALKNEKKTGELLQLPADFYRKNPAHHNKENEHGQNMAKTLNSLKEKRIQKLLVYIAFNKTLPQPIPTEEEDIYNKIKQILKKEKVDKVSTTVRINVDLPEIISPENNKLGPFKQNEIVELQETSDIKFIVENKIGEIIER